MHGSDPTLPDLVASPVLALVLLALARIDLAEGRLPDRLTGPLALAGLALAAWRLGGVPTAQAIGCLAGFGAFWAVGEAFWRLRGVDGLGLGDAKLFGAAGAWLGWQALPPLLLVATLGALAHAVLRGTARGTPLPFGPWLAGGFGVMWAAFLWS